MPFFFSGDHKSLCERRKRWNQRRFKSGQKRLKSAHKQRKSGQKVEFAFEIRYTVYVIPAENRDASDL